LFGLFNQSKNAWDKNERFGKRTGKASKKGKKKGEE
jgi:hypothetical protein